MVLAYYGYGYGYDPTWILLVITGIIAVVAQIRVSSSFAKYSKVESRTGLTGAEAAERHAIQHDEGYSFLKFRTMLFPIASFGSQFSFILILLGLFFGSFSVLIDVGIILFSFAVLFQIVTLPVEFNASSRALALLSDNGILYDSEVDQTKKVLSAAAMTYVASAATAIIQLARLLMLRGRNRD